MMGESKVSLAVVAAVLTMLGSAMVYVTSKDSEALKREIDIRVESVIKDGDERGEAISEIKDSMAVDDLREQADMESKGDIKRGLKAIIYDFQHLDAELHIRHRLYNGKFESLTERVGKLEVCFDPKYKKND